MLDNLKVCALFFDNSPKRSNLLQFIVDDRLKDHPTKRKALLQLCKTRWAERHKAFQHFYQAYTFIPSSANQQGSLPTPGPSCAYHLGKTEPSSAQYPSTPDGGPSYFQAQRPPS